MEDRSELAERVLDQIADAIIYADLSGAIVRWNRASSALFGYLPEEALGQSLDLIIPVHLRASHWSGFSAAMTKCHEASGTPYVDPRSTQERTQTVCRDDVCDREERRRR